MNDRNVRAFWHDVLGMKVEEFAALHGVSRDAVMRWQSGRADVPYDVAKRHGLNFGWLVGDDAQMWSERVLTLRESLRSYLATATLTAKTASDRFRVVLSWLRGQASDLVTDEYIARLLRMDVETYREALAGDVSVAGESIQRLATFSDVPVEWFASGDNSYVRREDSLNDLARDYDVSFDDAKAAIIAAARRHNESAF